MLLSAVVFSGFHSRCCCKTPWINAVQVSRRAVWGCCFVGVDVSLVQGWRSCDSDIRLGHSSGETCAVTLRQEMLTRSRAKHWSQCVRGAGIWSYLDSLEGHADVRGLRGSNFTLQAPVQEQLLKAGSAPEDERHGRASDRGLKKCQSWILTVLL